MDADKLLVKAFLFCGFFYTTKHFYIEFFIKKRFKISYSVFIFILLLLCLDIIVFVLVVYTLHS